MKVGYGGGIAVSGIPHSELPLEVGAPQLIRGLNVLFFRSEPADHESCSEPVIPFADVGGQAPLGSWPLPTSVSVVLVPVSPFESLSISAAPAGTAGVIRR